jgi:mannose-1-phosphate guanylyltransferase
MHAVILAGGRGTRLRPYTTAIPKPLVPVGDRYSILEIILMQLAHQGFTSVTLAIGHFGYLIRSYVGDGSRWGLSVTYVDEEAPLGTIGPLLPVLDTLPEHFLVMNGDVLTDLNFGEVLRGHVASGAPLTVATFDRRVHVDFGVLTVEGESITGFREKPTLPYEVSMGVYGMSRATLGRYQSGLPFGFDELVLDLLDRGDVPRVHPFDGYWLDIGRPEDYDRANADFEVLQPALLPMPPSGREGQAAALRRPGRPVGPSPGGSGCGDQHVLVVGGSGYVGGYVLDELSRRAGVEVTVLDRPSSPLTSFPTVELDVVEGREPELRRILRRLQPTAVINCAGAVSGDLETLARANVWLVGLLTAAIAETAPRSLLVHVGSSSEYGECTPGTPVLETTCPRATGSYGLSKLAGTKTVLEAAASGQMRGVVLRVFNAIGPGAGLSTLTGRVLAELDRVQVEGGSIRLGPLDAARDFVDVRDVASALVRAALLTGNLRGVYNVGRGQAVSVRHLVNALCREARYAGPIDEELPGSRRSGGVSWQCADITRARNDLGWEPAFELADSVRSIIGARAVA